MVRKGWQPLTVRWCRLVTALPCCLGLGLGCHQPQAAWNLTGTVNFSRAFCFYTQDFPGGADRLEPRVVVARRMRRLNGSLVHSIVTHLHFVRDTDLFLILFFSVTKRVANRLVCNSTPTIFPQALLIAPSGYPLLVSDPPQSWPRPKSPSLLPPTWSKMLLRLPRWIPPSCLVKNPNRK